MTELVGTFHSWQQQKAKENHTSEEAQDETARACLELLRAEGAATSSAVDATAVEYEAPSSITVQVQVTCNLTFHSRNE